MNRLEAMSKRLDNYKSVRSFKASKDKIIRNGRPSWNHKKYSTNVSVPQCLCAIGKLNYGCTYRKEEVDSDID